MPKYINGPFNYVQLEGNVNNIKKNITIFMDVHLDLNNQTRCESFDSQDISQYLYNIIKSTTIPLDFFMEIDEQQIKQPQTNRRDIYIGDVMEMFKSEFVLEKDKVKYSKSNPNVRLHYLDIRDHLNFLSIKNKINKHILPKINLLQSGNLDETSKINTLEQIKQHIEYIKIYTMKILEKYFNINNNKISQFDKKSQEYYLDKIIHKYRHKTLKTKLNDYFNAFFMEFSVNFNMITHDIIFRIYYYKIDINNPLNLPKLIKSYNKLTDIVFALYALITDVYFLRRFLDKDYIQNVLTYCGRNHALNYIFFLVKYCNFTITKIYNTGGLEIKDIDTKIKDIKEIDELDKIYNLFLLEAEKPKQCVEKPNYNIRLLGW
jgi:hypothetical protein